jgi:hypothetical protein
MVKGYGTSVQVAGNGKSGRAERVVSRQQQADVIAQGNCKSQTAEELRLSKNKLMLVPKEIGNLEQLKKVYLGQNKLTSLPKEIGNLKQLKELLSWPCLEKQAPCSRAEKLRKTYVCFGKETANSKIRLIMEYCCFA